MTDAPNFSQFAVFKHYRGGLYMKLCEARHTETEEVMVVYACALTGDVFCRPRSMFYDVVEWQGQQVPRFAPVPYIADKPERQRRIAVTIND